MSISLKTHKLLWGRSGNQCAICKNELIVDSTDPRDDPSIIGDEAHIVARKETFTRGNYAELSMEERNSYFNLILLCKTHHKQIDDQPTYFTVERLREIKTAHEREVRSHRRAADESRQQDEITYSGYIDEWEQLADLNDWRRVSGWINSADTPTLPTSWYDAQKKFLIWVISRIWPNRYPLLEAALFNYKAVIQDLLNIFDRHIQIDRHDTEYLYTEKFYQIKEWDPERYHKLLKKYNEHQDLLCDLFFELTRAANYVCDHARKFIFSGYRLREGALLIERNSVGFELATVHARVEYRGKERIKTPYPGLKKFKAIRYTRDYAIDPNPRPPSFDEKES